MDKLHLKNYVDLARKLSGIEGSVASVEKYKNL